LNCSSEVDSKQETVEEWSERCRKVEDLLEQERSQFVTQLAAARCAREATVIVAQKEPQPSSQPVGASGTATAATAALTSQLKQKHADAEHNLSALCSEVARLKADLLVARTQATSLSAALATSTAENAHMLQQLQQTDTNGLLMADALEMASRDIAAALRSTNVTTGTALAMDMQAAREEVRVARGAEGVAREATDDVRRVVAAMQEQLAEARQEREAMVLHIQDLFTELAGMRMPPWRNTLVIAVYESACMIATSLVQAGLLPAALITSAMGHRYLCECFHR
jgi:hypothetical protein